MKFKIEKQKLTKMLDRTSMALPARSSDSILLGLLIEIDSQGMMKITGSDNEIRIEETVQLSSFEEGSTVLPGKLFTDIVRSMPDEEITVKAEEKGLTSVTTENSSFQIASFDPAEYPAAGQYIEDKKIKVNRERFIEAINKTTFAASKTESRGVIVGVLLDINGDSMTMVALDGFRIAVSQLKLEDSPEEPASLIINARILNEILKLISSQELGMEDIEIGFNNSKNNAEIITDNTKITMSLIKGTYLNYKNLLPKESTTKVRIDKNTFRKAIERASLMSDDRRNNLIKLRFTSDNLEISSRSESGNLNDDIPVSVEGSDLEIGFNAKYLLDGLKVMDSEDVIMKFETSVRPCTIEPEEGGYIYMVLPVRIM